MGADWIEHTRARDGERVGWMKPVGDGFIAIDLLGRQHTDIVDWVSAEQVLDALGIGYLADPYEFRLDDGSWLRVRIVEVSADMIRLKKDDWGDMSAPQVYYTAHLPISPMQLRRL